MNHAYFSNLEDKESELEDAAKKIKLLIEEADKIPAWKFLSRKKQMAVFIKSVIPGDELKKITESVK